jgi:hypothetical protein
MPLENSCITRVFLLAVDYCVFDLLFTVCFVAGVEDRATDGVFERVGLPDVMTDEGGLAQE